VRDRRWAVRLLTLAALVAIVAAVGTVRDGGALLTGGGIAVGLVAAWLVLRPRALIALAVSLPVIAGAALSVPSTQIRVYNLVQASARLHRNFIETPGWVYTLLDQRFYEDGGLITDMRFAEAARYVVRAAERYVTVPLPWEVKSTAMGLPVCRLRASRCSAGTSARSCGFACSRFRISPVSAWSVCASCSRVPVPFVPEPRTFSGKWSRYGHS
jgi:hypothetical protein